ncbi:uncharacterized protein LOC115622601 [Scaptodrosophila lebanonensis]|uniref:Uncharacterized protein LOC115622601 n=1 Tax=Drosophila lebanonensis TaxID=7225 RepID=A0A6J2TAT0_DROLE|nr:uncharacterized protein LOC115622601 [Scaptodrosophila lebanonensis]
MYSRIFFYALQLGIAVSLVFGDCNTCTYPSQVACVSDTQFQFCKDSSPTGPVNSCPDGSVCTGGSVICEDSSVAESACSGCNVCNQNQTFACTGPRTFALCLGTSNVSSITGNCAPYHVCNIDTPHICGNETLGTPATCSFLDSTTPPDSTTAPTTAPTPDPTDPTAYCRLIQNTGRFPYGILLESTCRQYISCYIRNGVWNGIVYYCPYNTFFDSAGRICTANVPPRCTTGIQNIRLLSLTLE